MITPPRDERHRSRSRSRSPLRASLLATPNCRVRATTSCSTCLTSPPQIYVNLRTPPGHDGEELCWACCASLIAAMPEQWDCTGRLEDIQVLVAEMPPATPVNAEEHHPTPTRSRSWLQSENLCEQCNRFLQAFAVQGLMHPENPRAARYETACLCYYCTASLMLRAHCDLDVIRSVVDIVDRLGEPHR